jgi:N-acetylmuramoyl-L-alanine amidase
MRTIAVILLVALGAFAASAAGADKGLTVKGVRFFSYAGFTRIVFETQEAAPYVLTRSGDGKSVYFSSYGGPFTLTAATLPTINDGVVKTLESRQDGSQKAITILLGPAAGEVKDFVLRGPDRIVVDVLRGAAPVVGSGAETRRVIMIDPGHGGSDTGIMSGQGPEKTLTLELALALRKALLRTGAKLSVLLTRDQDLAATLDQRAAAANASNATLFVSLHLSDGPETHVFILDPDEGQTLPAPAGRRGFLEFDTQSEHQQSLWGTQQAEHSQESGRLGREIVRALTGRDNAEPDQAPLALLEPVDAAAVVVEVGAGQNRMKTAEAIGRGIEHYVRGK